MTRRIEIHGHRGARWNWPENTLEGFRRTAALGVDAVEADVTLSADGIVIISHDPALNPDLTRDANGAFLTQAGPAIHTLPAAALAAYDVGRLRPGSAYAAQFPEQAPIDGARIPTLGELFRLPPPLRFNIETKSFPDTPGKGVDGIRLVNAVVAQADRAGVVARLIVQSFDWAGLIALRRARPEIAVSFLTEARTIAADALWWAGLRRSAHGGSVPRAVAAAGGTCWGPRHSELDAAAIAEAHALGVRVIPWTVNAEADMRRLIAWGVDGIISDRPDLVRAVLASLGQPVPPSSPAG